MYATLHKHYSELKATEKQQKRNFLPSPMYQEGLDVLKHERQLWSLTSPETAPCLNNPYLPFLSSI